MEFIITTSQYRICLAGDGWGAISAFKALSRMTDSLQVATDDLSLKDILRPADVQLSKLSQAKADLVVCAGYKPIVSSVAINLKPHINIHYSLLPRYRGMHSTVWAIINGEQTFGCTAHLMNEFIDDGPILAQFQITSESKNAREIIEECNDWVNTQLDKIIIGFLNGSIKPKQQDKAFATWVPKRNIEDCYIDFNDTTQAIERLLRALVDPYPRPRFKLKDLTYEIHSAKVVRRPYICTNGRIVNIDNEGVWIKISDGLLIATEIVCNGRPIPWNAFQIGNRLG